MFAVKKTSKIKDTMSTVAFTYAVVQGARGWYYLIKEGTLAVREARARRTK